MDLVEELQVLGVGLQCSAHGGLAPGLSSVVVVGGGVAAIAGVVLIAGVVVVVAFFWAVYEAFLKA